MNVHSEHAISRTPVILPINGHLKSFGGRIPAVRKNVLFEGPQVSLQQGEVHTSIVTQGSRIWMNDLVSVVTGNDVSAE